MESRIPFFDGVGKRKSKLEARIPFSHIVGKQLALRYSHYIRSSIPFVKEYKFVEVLTTSKPARVA